MIFIISAQAPRYLEMFLSNKTSQDNCKSNHPPPATPAEDAAHNAKVKYFLSMETKLIIRCSCYSRYTWGPSPPHSPPPPFLARPIQPSHSYHFSLSPTQSSISCLYSENNPSFSISTNTCFTS